MTHRRKKKQILLYVWKWLGVFIYCVLRHINTIYFLSQCSIQCVSYIDVMANMEIHTDVHRHKHKRTQRHDNFDIHNKGVPNVVRMVQ